MSSTSLLPTHGSENSIYLAFSFVLSVYFINHLFPSSFDSDLGGYITLALVSTSLVAGLFFYAKPERRVTTLFQRILLGRKDNTEIFIARTILVTRAWEWSVSELPTISEEAEYLIGTLDAESSLHTDLWVIKGAVYYAITSFLLPSILKLQPPYSFLLPLVIVSVVGFSGYLRYREFLGTAHMVLCLRYLDDRIRADMTAREVRKRMPPSSETLPELEVNYKKGLLTHIEELRKVLENRQWDRFRSRFESLAESFESFSNVRLRESYNDHVQSWAWALQNLNVLHEVDCWTRFKNERMVLMRLLPVTDGALYRRLRKLLSVTKIDNKMSFFWNIDPIHIDSDGIPAVVKLIELSMETPDEYRSLALALQQWIGCSKLGMKFTFNVLFEVPLRSQTPLLAEMGNCITPEIVAMILEVLSQRRPRESQLAARLLGHIREFDMISTVVPSLRNISLISSNLGIEALIALSKLEERFGDTGLEGVIISTLANQSEVKAYVTLHLLEERKLSDSNTEILRKLLSGNLVSNSTPIRKKSIQLLGGLNGKSYVYPDISTDIVRMYLRVEPRLETEAISKGEMMSTFKTGTELERAKPLVKFLRGSRIDGIFTYTEIAKFLNDGRESAEAIGLLLLRDGSLEGTPPHDLLKRVIEFLGSDKKMLGILAASVIGKRQDISLNAFIEHITASRPYDKEDVILALGCLGTNLANFPNIILELQNSFDIGKSNLAPIVLDTLSKIGQRVQELPTILTFFEDLLQNREVSDALMITLLEASESLFDSSSLPSLIARVEDLRSPWLYDIGMNAIAKAKLRVGMI